MSTLEAPFVRFKGKFKDLKKNGWTFGKYFASNYRAYNYEVNGELESLMVWQHHGGYVEVCSLFRRGTVALLDYILNNEIEFPQSKMFGEMPFAFTFNSETGEIRERVLETDDLAFVAMINKLTKEEMREWVKEHRGQREFTMSRELYEFILSMHKDGLIEIIREK